MIILALPLTLFGFDKPGTTAAAFLQIPVSARLAAMGGAGVALSGSPDLLALNPAASSSRTGTGVSVTYADWFAGLRHQSLAVVAPVSPAYEIGVHVLSFGGDEFEQTTIQQQEGTGVMVDYADVSAGASLIMHLTDRFTCGVTAKYIHQSLFHETASTFAGDVGTYLKTDLPGFTIGMAMNNLGGEMQLEGRDLYTGDPEEQYETSKWPLPLTFQTGIGFKLFGRENAYRINNIHGLTLAADARHLNEGETTVHLGGEYGFNEVIFLRAGRTIGHDTEEWAFGGGVNVNLYGYQFRAGFAYADLGDLDTVQRISLTLLKKN